MRASKRSLDQVAVGTTHGDLVVTGPYERRGANNDAWLPCRCVCGKELWVRFRSLTESASCGHRRVHLTHGATAQGKVRLYRIWQGFRARCSNPNEPSYPNYGGRGITVAPAWERYEVFRDWALAHGYDEGLQIDRIDNDGHYTPENCHWVTPAQNLRNTRRSRRLAAFGEVKTMIDWSEDPRCVVSYGTMESRLRHGWDIEDALTRPKAGT